MLKEYAAEIRSFKLVPADGGRFEFSINGELVFSKKELKRHAQPGEILEIFRDHLGLD